MNYCLGKEEFPMFFDAFMAKDSLHNTFEEDLQMRVDACLNWEDNIGVLIYVFTYYLQKKSKIGQDANPEYIERLFKLSDAGSFILETMDRNFVTYMLNYSRNRIDEDLSDSLTLILQNYLDHSYDSSFCF